MLAIDKMFFTFAPMKPETIFALIVASLIILYTCWWLFTFTSPWIGISLLLVFIYATIKYINNKLKNHEHKN